MKRLTILFFAILVTFLLPYWLGLQFPPIRRDYFRMVYAGVISISLIGVILLWKSEEGASRIRTLIKLALYTGALLLIQPLRPFALSFYPLALMLAVVLGVLLLFSRSSAAPGWLSINVVRNWAFAGFSFLLANGIVLAASSFLAPPAVPVAATPDEQVQKMAEMDQMDRSSGRILLAPKRDDLRVRTTERLLQNHTLSSPDSQLSAALILQHGQCPRHFQMAYEQARRAYEAGDKDAKWLMQATYDRWQISLGKPQKYNTQPDFRPGVSQCETSIP